MSRSPILPHALFCSRPAVRTTVPAGLPKTQSSAARASLTSLHMGKTIYQKKEIIRGVKSDLENAQVIFSTDMSTLNIKQINALRAGLPEGSKAICVKNRLLKRAISGSEVSDKPSLPFLCLCSCWCTCRWLCHYPNP